MKQLKLATIIVILIFLSTGCAKREEVLSKQNGETTVSGEEAPKGNLVEIKLPTMQCGMCKRNIEAAVRKIYGVNKVTVSVKDKIATVDFDNSKTDIERIEGAIVMAGYQANNKPSDKKAYDKLDACCKIGGHN